MITQKELKQRLHYNPLTGIFTWLVVKKHNLVGKEAGCSMKIGYRDIYMAPRRYYSHRLAWLYVYGYMPDKIDHKDGIRYNNRIDNLRDVSQKENTKNSSLRCDNTTGHPGIGKWKNNRFRCRIYVDGKEIALGIFNTYEEALKVRLEAEVKYNFHPNHGKS